MPDLAEALLARFTTSTRAAAIMGDLEELAATRTRLWFWTAYVRTVVTLTWRTPIGFIVAIISGTFICRATTTWLVNHRIRSLMHVGIYGKDYPHVWLFNARLTTLMAQGLFFAMPFVLIRFGLRNRLTQLACALFLIALPFYSHSFLLMDISSISCVLAIALALLLPRWRRPLIVLAATCIPTVAFPLLFDLSISHVYRASPALFDWSWRHPAIFAMYEMTTFSLAAIVCLYLNRRLLHLPQMFSATPNN